MAMENSEESTGSSGEWSWIEWFCNLEGHEFLGEVDETFIRDAFNLYGIRNMYHIDKYSEAMRLILSPVLNDIDKLMEDQNFLELNKCASELYGLIHARYIISPTGLQQMCEKYSGKDFGVCPRVLCNNQPVLPMGLSHELRKSRVKVYCPRCQDVYVPKGGPINIDGAYFGPSFAHIFFQTFPQLHPDSLKMDYFPRIYGFTVHKKKGSKYRQAEEEEKKEEVKE